ncbi:MAG: HypC/HybG/HupF family hydrogenase formation chaperone [Candidatus Omnitrophota bacterium]
MCLAIPMKIERIEGAYASVSAPSLEARVNIQLLSKPRKGDYVLVHAGVAIEKINRRKAQETLVFYRQIAEKGVDL